MFYEKTRPMKGMKDGSFHSCLANNGDLVIHYRGSVVASIHSGVINGTTKSSLMLYTGDQFIHISPMIIWELATYANMVVGKINNIYKDEVKVKTKPKTKKALSLREKRIADTVKANTKKMKLKGATVK